MREDTKKQIEVHLHTNDSCNLKCIHCYNRSGEKAVCNVPDADSLLELIQYFCTEYDAEIHLEGGEIFLRPELLSAMNYLPVEMLQCITITTNGTICIEEPETIAMLNKIHALRISVEGHTEEQQRFVRGISLKNVIDHALFYKSKDISVWMRLTMTCQNWEHLLDSTLPYYINLGFKKFQIYEFQTVGRGEINESLLAVSDAAFVSFLEKLKVWKGFCEKTDLQIRFLFSRVRQERIYFYKEQLEQNTFKVEDIPEENGVSIHADGSVYLCAWDNEESHCIMNVYHEGLKHMAVQLKQMRLTHQCSHCSAVRIVLDV